MGTSSSKPGGQRNNTTSASGQKKRSETLGTHVASRVEPSHVTRQTRTERVKKAAAQPSQKNAEKNT